MAWTVRIGQEDDLAGIRTQVRVTNIQINEEFGHKDFSVTITKPTSSERLQVKGRIDSAIIQINRGSEILLEGFIENVENGSEYVTYSGRSFLVLLGYSTSSETDNSGNTKAEYENATGSSIITNLITNFCYTKDAELTYTDITFTETYDGIVKLHGKKVYQIVKEMCSSYGKDIWSDATWTGNSITAKNIRVGEKTRGTSGSPYKTLRGGVEIAQIPVIKYKTDNEMMNCLRVIGKGEGKDQVSVWCEDTTSITAYGYIEGNPYRSNMISKESTAKSIGDAIIAAKKDPITQLQVNPAFYINDLKYGDWVNIIDSYSGIDTVKRIKKIVYVFNSQNGELMQIELGDKFNNYENIINDLTKGDVDAEKEMTLAGGSFRITPNTPPSDYVRIDKGSWYGTDGVFYTWDTDTFRPFWGGSPPYNATTVNNYFKALIQIKDNAASTSDIEYKTSLTSGAHTGYDQLTAEGETISPDTGYTPLGEIILKCKVVDGTVYAVEATDEGGSYIWRDVRPIIGSSATGFGGEGLWENTGSPEYSRLILAQDIDLQDKILYFHKSIGNMRIYRSGDNLIINPASTASSIGLGGILSVVYGIANCGNIAMSNERSITNCDGITMYDSGSILNMNYGSITNSDDITLYDGGSMSPKLSLTVPTVESVGGVYLVASDNYFWINGKDDSILLRYAADIDTWDFYGDIDITGDILMSIGDITGVSDIKSYYSTGIDFSDNGAGFDVKIALADTTYAAKCYADIDMNSNDIVDCGDISGTTSSGILLDFRGDGNERIYYAGSPAYGLIYTATGSHTFYANSSNVATLNTGGLLMATGKYIKSASGDLELRAPSGSKIKFVIG